MMKKAMFLASLALIISLFTPTNWAWGQRTDADQDTVGQNRATDLRRDGHRDDDEEQERHRGEAMENEAEEAMERGGGAMGGSGEAMEKDRSDRTDVSSRHEELAGAYAERLVRRLQAAVERISKLLERIEARLTKIEERGIDLSQAQDLQTEAKSVLAQAQAAVNDLLPVTLATEVGDGSTMALPDAIHDFQTRARRAISLIKQSHAAVVNVVVAMRQAVLTETGPTTDETSPATN